MSEVQIQMMEMETPQLSSSPSFSSYSSETLAQIAARVIQELRREPHSLSVHDHDDTLFDSSEEENDNNVIIQGNDDHHDKPNQNDDDDFEFAFVSRDPNSSPVSADDIFYNGQIRPTYPLFDRNLLNGAVSISPIPTTNIETAAVGASRRRLPLRKLMFEEERETGWCSTSTSEADDSNELNGVTAGTYCVWTPPSKKKSNSMGSSSKRWKLRDLLLRSHSDGKKEPLLFLAPTKVAPKNSSAGNGGAGAVAAAKDGDHTKRKKSFLPYRQELVGFFSNGNGIGRNLQPF